VKKRCEVPLAGSSLACSVSSLLVAFVKIRVYGSNGELIGIATMPSTPQQVVIARQQHQEALSSVKTAMEYGGPDYSDAWWAKFSVALVCDQ